MITNSGPRPVASAPPAPEPVDATNTDPAPVPASGLPTWIEVTMSERDGRLHEIDRTVQFVDRGDWPGASHAWSWVNRHSRLTEPNDVWAERRAFALNIDTRHPKTREAVGALSDAVSAVLSLPINEHGSSRKDMTTVRITLPDGNKQTRMFTFERADPELARLRDAVIAFDGVIESLPSEPK